MKKVTTLFITVCFLFSSVIAQPLEAVIDNVIVANKFNSIVDNLSIPSSTARVTDEMYCGSSKVVLNIQDLHCHPEVQKNIGSILKILDEKYGLSKVYVEGGYGDVDTSWICDINNKAVKKEIIENLINQGRLTGSEYYSVISGRTNLLKGIENEAVHKANIVRLDKILERKEFYEKKIKELERDLEFMGISRFSSSNKKFNRLVDKHKNGAVSSEKYYILLGKFVERINKDPDKFNNIFSISMENYPSINAYLELTQSAKQLNYKNISRQLQEYLKLLKSKISYNAYNGLIEKTDNFSKLDEHYAYLAKLGRGVLGTDLSARFTDLCKFFGHVEINKDLNPIKLIQEEKRLVEEIRMGFSENIGELEVSFLSDFFSYFNDYLLNRLSADDYEYFAQRFGKFKLTWSKYAFKNKIADLAEDFILLDEYYKVNSDRNNYFINNIEELGVHNSPFLNPVSVKEEDKGNAAVSEGLKNSEMIVIVTGGFHTEGLKKILAERRISCITITPNVTQDTKTSSEMYRRLAKEQANLARSTEVLKPGKPHSFVIPQKRLSRNIRSGLVPSECIIPTGMRGQGYPRELREAGHNSLALGLASQMSNHPLFELAIKAANRKLQEAGITDREKLVKEIENSIGVKVKYDANNGIITFDNNSQIKLEEKAGYIEAKGIKPSEFVSEAVKESINALVNIEELIADIVFGNVAKLLKKAMLIADKLNLIIGNGLIYDIEHDPQLMNRETIDGIEKEILSKFPEFVQLIAGERQRRQIDLDNAADRAGWLKTLLAIDLLRDLIISNYSSTMAQLLGTSHPSVEGATISFSENDLPESARDAISFIPDNGKMADIGISDGGTLVIYAAQNNPDLYITATSLDEKGLRTAEDQFFKAKSVKEGQVKFALQDVTREFPFDNDSFDFIYSRLCLHYLNRKQVQSVFHKMFQALKPGGKIYIVVKSNRDYWAVNKKSFNEESGMTTYIDNGKEFERQYISREKAEQYSSNAGFTIQEIREANEQLHKDFEKKIPDKHLTSLLILVASKPENQIDKLILSPNTSTKNAGKEGNQSVISALSINFEKFLGAVGLELDKPSVNFAETIISQFEGKDGGDIVSLDDPSPQAVEALNNAADLSDKLTEYLKTKSAVRSAEVVVTRGKNTYVKAGNDICGIPAFLHQNKEGASFIFYIQQEFINALYDENKKMGAEPKSALPRGSLVAQFVSEEVDELFEIQSLMLADENLTPLQAYFEYHGRHPGKSFAHHPLITMLAHQAGVAVLGLTENYEPTVIRPEVDFPGDEKRVLTPELFNPSYFTEEMPQKILQYLAELMDHIQFKFVERGEQGADGFNSREHDEIEIDGKIIPKTAKASRKIKVNTTVTIAKDITFVQMLNLVTALNGQMIRKIQESDERNQKRSEQYLKLLKKNHDDIQKIVLNFIYAADYLEAVKTKWPEELDLSETESQELVELFEFIVNGFRAVTKGYNIQAKDSKERQIAIAESWLGIDQGWLDTVKHSIPEKEARLAYLISYFKGNQWLRNIAYTFALPANALDAAIMEMGGMLLDTMQSKLKNKWNQTLVQEIESIVANKTHGMNKTDPEYTSILISVVQNEVRNYFNPALNIDNPDKLSLEFEKLAQDLDVKASMLVKLGEISPSRIVDTHHMVCVMQSYLCGRILQQKEIPVFWLYVEENVKVEQYGHVAVLARLPSGLYQIVDSAFPKGSGEVSVQYIPTGTVEQGLASSIEIPLTLNPASRSLHHKIVVSNFESGLKSAVWYNLGIALYDQKRYLESETVFKKALKLNPQYFDVWNNLGSALYNQNRYSEAEISYREVLSLNPKFFMAWKNLGNTLNKQNRFLEAEVAFKEALKLNSKYLSAWNNMAKTYKFLNQPAAEKICIHYSDLCKDGESIDIEKAIAEIDAAKIADINEEPGQLKGLMAENSGTQPSRSLISSFEWNPLLEAVGSGLNPLSVKLAQQVLVAFNFSMTEDYNKLIRAVISELNTQGINKDDLSILIPQIVKIIKNRIDIEVFMSQSKASLDDKERVLKKGIDNGDVKKILQIGLWDEAYMELLERNYSDAKIVGLDRDPRYLVAASKKYPQNEFLLRNILNWPDYYQYEGKFAAVVLGSSLHSIYFAEGPAKARQAIEAVTGLLKPGGHLIIRDGLRPQEGRREIEFKNPEVKKKFIQFVKDFKGNRKLIDDDLLIQPVKTFGSKTGAPIDDLEQYLRDSDSVNLEGKDLREFLMKYLYYGTESWQHEMVSLSGPISEKEYMDFFKEKFDIEKEIYTLDYLVKRWRSDVKLTDGKDYPDSHISLVLKKKPEMKRQKPLSFMNKSDFVVIGTGNAGLTAALRLAKFGKVKLVTKGKLRQTNTEYAQGGIAGVIHKDDTIQSHIDDTHSVGGGLTEEEAVRVLVEKGSERIKDLIDLGVPFDIDENGELLLAQEGGHSRARVARAGGDATGREIERVLAENVENNKNIEVFEGVYITELLTKNKKAYGVKGIITETGQEIDFLAQSTLIATGGYAQIYSVSSNPGSATGDLIALAYEAGAEISDMEMVQFHPTTLVVPENRKLSNPLIPFLPQNFLVSEAVRGAGGKLVNINGERFMNKYDAESMELAPRDIVARAIFNEMKETGSDFVYLDVSNLHDESTHQPITFKERFPTIYGRCLEMGLDLDVEHLIPVAPAAHYCMGGIKTNVKGETNIEGLHVAGEAARVGVHGANRLASNSLLEGVTFGYEAAENMIKRKNQKEKEPDIKWNIEPGNKKYVSNKEITVNELTELHKIDHKMREIMTKYVGIIRDESGLKEAINRLTEIEKSFENNNFRQSIARKILEGKFVTVRMVAESALQRTESRGAHYRSDYPETDDKNWKKPTIIVEDKVSELQEFLISVDKDREELDADVLLFCTNDDIETIREAVELYRDRKVKKILISGGIGRLTPSLINNLKTQFAEIIENDSSITQKSEAEIIKAIMLNLAKKMDFTINEADILLETTSTNTKENMDRAKPILKGIRNELGLSSEDPLKIAYIATPLQQFRTKGVFVKSFSREIDEGNIEGISYTRNPDLTKLKKYQLDKLIIGEMWKIILYSVKKDILPEFEGRRGLNSIPGKYWQAVWDLINTYPSQADLKKYLNDIAINTRDANDNTLFKTKKDLIKSMELTPDNSMLQMINWVYDGRPTNKGENQLDLTEKSDSIQPFSSLFGAFDWKPLLAAANLGFGPISVKLAQKVLKALDFSMTEDYIKLISEVLSELDIKGIKIEKQVHIMRGPPYAIPNWNKEQEFVTFIKDEETGILHIYIHESFLDPSSSPEKQKTKLMLALAHEYLESTGMSHDKVVAAGFGIDILNDQITQGIPDREIQNQIKENWQEQAEYFKNLTLSPKIGVNHIVRSENLSENIIDRYKNSSEFVHTWFSDLPETVTEKLYPIDFKVNIPGVMNQIDVWVGVKEGALVIYLDLSKAGVPIERYDEALSLGAVQIISFVGGTDNVNGDKNSREGIRKIVSKENAENYKNMEFKPVIVIDHAMDPERVKREFSDSGINNILTVSSALIENIPEAGISAVIQKMLIKHNATSVTMGENKILKMDIKDLDGFVEAGDVFKAVGNGQMMVDWKIFEKALAERKTTENKIKDFLDDLGRDGVIVHVEYIAAEKITASMVKKFFDMGFKGVNLDLSALDRKNARELLSALRGFPLTAVTTPSGVESPAPNITVKLNEVKGISFNVNDVINLEIPSGMTKEQIRKNMEYLPLSNTIIFHSGDAAELINATRDLLDKKALASFINILLNFGKREISTPEKAKRLGYNWDPLNLPELLSGNAGKQLVKALIEASLEGSGLSVDSAIYEQVMELGTPELKREYLSAIAGKILIKEKLLKENKEIAMQYINGSYKFANPLYEEMLGSALLKQYEMATEELKRDEASSVIFKTASADNLNSLLIKLSNDINYGQAQSGSITAVIEMILLDIYSDYELTKPVDRKYKGFDSRSLKTLLGAA